MQNEILGLYLKKKKNAFYTQALHLAKGRASTSAGVKKNSSLVSIKKSKSSEQGCMPKRRSIGTFGFSNALKHSLASSTRAYLHRPTACGND